MTLAETITLRKKLDDIIEYLLVFKKEKLEKE
jgi:nitrate reductase NapAB chaperone NapD